jgi:UDP-GlcNAc3NAcA epimerase
MSQVFFDEMKIPKPDYNLNINAMSHGAMTGRMLEEIEKVLLKEKPDIVLVYGDTNSTLAGALAASKLHIPVAHVEAGLRSYNMKMPEEQNRILTDHISQYLFCPTDTAVKNLKKEGIEKGVHQVGDVMYDAYLYYKSLIFSSSSNARHPERSEGSPIIIDLPPKFMLITLHRAENTDDKSRLKNIVEGLNEAKVNGIFPIHPRTVKKMNEFGLKFKDNIKLIDPVSYFEMLYLEDKCEFIVTDSGGVQKEAYFAKKPCITLRDETEWVETVEAGWNRCVEARESKIGQILNRMPIPNRYTYYFGKGNAGCEILKCIF